MLCLPIRISLSLLPRIRLICLLLLSAGCFSYAEDAVLDLRKGNNLLWIYDAGLRPRHGTSPTTGCEVIHKSIRLVLPDGQAIIADVSWMDINVMGDGRLASITMDMKGDYSVSDAREIVRNYSSILGPPKEDFENFAKETLANERGFIRGIFGSKKWALISVGWKVMPNMFSATPFRFKITVNWNWPDTDRPISFEPLKPPPGYEQYPMERNAPHPTAPPASNKSITPIKERGK